MLSQDVPLILTYGHLPSLAIVDGVEDKDLPHGRSIQHGFGESLSRHPLGISSLLSNSLNHYKWRRRSADALVTSMQVMSWFSYSSQQHGTDPRVSAGPHQVACVYR
jgi:hypothetical protein